jgi:hypothetical protein
VADDLVGPLEACTRWQGDRSNEIGAIKWRDKTGWRASELKIREPNEPAVDHQHQRRNPERAPRQLAITLRKLLEEPVEAREEKVERDTQRPPQAGSLRVTVGFEQKRGERR